MTIVHYLMKYEQDEIPHSERQTQIIRRKAIWIIRDRCKVFSHLSIPLEQRIPLASLNKIGWGIEISFIKNISNIQLEVILEWPTNPGNSGRPWKTLEQKLPLKKSLENPGNVIDTWKILKSSRRLLQKKLSSSFGCLNWCTLLS